MFLEISLLKSLCYEYDLMTNNVESAVLVSRKYASGLALTVSRAAPSLAIQPRLA